MKKRNRIIILLQIIALCTTMLFGLSANTAPSHAATLVVTNENDSGAGSLRQAINDASFGDTITFAENVTQITLLSQIPIQNKNLIIYGCLDSDGNPKITCSFATLGFSISNSSVKLYGLSLEGDAQITISSVYSNTAIENCKFDGKNKNVRAMQIVASEVSINQCLITNYFEPFISPLVSYGSDLSILNSTISNNEGYMGGAIFIVDSNIIIDHTTFTQNTAQYGGSIFGDAELNITNSQFSNNTAAEIGGAICNFGNCNLNNSSFTGNSAPRASAICSLYQTIITNTTFYGNSSNEQNSGVLETYDKIVLVHSTIANNSGIGILLNDDSQNIYAYNSIIVGNIDQDGNPNQSNKIIIGGKNIIEDIPTKGSNTYQMIFGSSELENGHIAPLSYASGITTAPKLNTFSFIAAQLTTDEVTEILDNVQTDAVGTERNPPIIYGAIEQLSRPNFFNILTIIWVITALILIPLLIVFDHLGIEEP